MPQSFKRLFRPNRPKAFVPGTKTCWDSDALLPQMPWGPLVLEPHLCIGYAPVP